MRSLLLLSSLALILPAAAEIDLTPKMMMIGGGLVKRAYFSDGDKKYAVTIDDETRLSAADGGAIFRFTSIAQASMQLRKSPVAKPPAFTADTLPDYLKAAEKLLPVGAAEVTITSQAENVFPINRWKSFRVIYGYQIGGATYLESITFLFLDDGQQIVIQTGAQKRNFEAIAQRADDIVRRWHEVLPGDEKGEN